MTPEEVGGKEGPGAWGEGKQVGSAGLSLPAAPAACPASTLKQGLDHAGHLLVSWDGDPSDGPPHILCVPGTHAPLWL